MLETFQRLFIVAWHGNVYSAIVIVPIDGETSVQGARPVFLDCVLVFQRRNEMVDIIEGRVFDAEIINN